MLPLLVRKLQCEMKGFAVRVCYLRCNQFLPEGKGAACQDFPEPADISAVPAAGLQRLIDRVPALRVFFLSVLWKVDGQTGEPGLRAAVVYLHPGQRFQHFSGGLIR